MVVDSKIINLKNGLFTLKAFLLRLKEKHESSFVLKATI